VAPHLAVCREIAPQREHALRAVFNVFRYIVRTGNRWRFMPGNLPPWAGDYQQTQRCVRAGVFG
jgi:transposase